MRLLALLTLMLVATTGCAAFTDDASNGGRVTVAAAFYPLAFVAERVGGDDVSVTNLTQPGAEPHDLELTIKETAEIEDADLVLVEHGLQPAVDDAVEQVASGAVLDVADVVELEPADEHADDHGSEPEAHEGHEHGDLDPHFWQDPDRMATLTEAVADALSEIDPDHADTYRANADELVGELHELTTAYDEGLRGCARDTVVVSHDAFGYLERFGLHIEGIAGLSPDSEPTPADLARLQDLIDAEGITTVFSERLVSPRLTQTLADDMGISTAILDPIEGLSDETAGEDYLSLMRENLAALQQANGCPT
ncbi:MAG TPA: metal ABC transporter substrate-binding protein [Nocardioides sp.]|uniref:metal ABC transporter substrate-binding protein n=1 Tax=uncultured Nocardioides sp. TaxID=198441 RepID=UPI002627E9D5|nr:metal ABC transporter substrate-binding protein [uncultured Nocardioides sp.]HRI96778.1 metal ABC transporter substrate-binding protein [Nocardioides sp.]HRK46572.1 metal ABC transporter substrate-binding protein [Nocardioides sp.]